MYATNQYNMHSWERKVESYSKRPIDHIKPSPTSSGLNIREQIAAKNQYVRSLDDFHDEDLAQLLAKIRNVRHKTVPRPETDFIGAGQEPEDESEDSKSTETISGADMDDLVAICCLQSLSNSPPKEETIAHTSINSLASVRKTQRVLRQQEDTSPTRRSRVPMACTRCKLAHTRCDTKRPCSRCVRRGDICIDAVPKRRGRKRTEDTVASEQRRPTRVRRTSMMTRDRRAAINASFARPTGDLSSNSSVNSIQE
mmetsp:Transcript_18034/g.27031  ORF Transcript_18034/g.27031 Transcript_18034/m.27031 type:complete len:255 (+) Transcript_18034:95-859(+)